MLATAKPNQPTTAAQVARQMCIDGSIGRERFMSTVCPDFLAGIEQAFADKGVQQCQLNASRWPPEMHYLQGIDDPSAISALMRMNKVIMRLRSLRTRGLRFDSSEDLVKHGAQLYFREHLRCTRPTTNCLERKRQRLKPPPCRRGFVLYRSDGAARGQGGTATRQSDVVGGLCVTERLDTTRGQRRLPGDGLAKTRRIMKQSILASSSRLPTHSLEDTIGYAISWIACWLQSGHWHLVM